MRPASSAASEPDAGAPSSERALRGTLDDASHWQLAVDWPDAALLSVHGKARDNLWIVGANDRNGPVVLRFEGGRWERRNTGLYGVDLWWVHAVSESMAFIGGSRGTLLRDRGGVFELLEPPGSGREQIWGIWGAGEDELYVVGRADKSGAFMWHYQAERWDVVALPTLPPESTTGEAAGLFKVWGRWLPGMNSPDVWAVGGSGVVLRGNADSGFELLNSGVSEQLVGLGGDSDFVWTLGGGLLGVALRWDRRGTARVLTPEDAPLLQGVALDSAGVWVMGLAGTIYRSTGLGWYLVDTGIDLWPETLHAAWVDPSGGVWAVGGNVFGDLRGGVVYHRGLPVPGVRAR